MGYKASIKEGERSIPIWTISDRHLKIIFNLGFIPTYKKKNHAYFGFDIKNYFP